MKRSLLNIALIGAGAAFLAACGGNGNGGGGGSGGGGGGGSTPKVETNFGAGFAAAFQTTPDGPPREPAATDVIALNLGADPIPVD